MAEQVNQRIEQMINELEQMRRTNLYDEDEIKEISRKHKEFEYKVQRRVKEKEDYVQYIAYELALLEDISLRRKQNNLGEKKKDIEYAVAKRLNRLFKQFIYRFQNDIEIYFEYIKFCKSVGFYDAASGIIGQMLQVHGEKPKMWQMAAKWECLEQNNLECARTYLLKGIHRHPEADILYIDLFEIELFLAFKTKEEEEKAKQLKRADVIWRNGSKNIKEIDFLCKICDISIKHDVEDMTNDIKTAIWSRNDEKEVWSYIAAMELKGCHWKEIEKFLDYEKYSPELNCYRAAYEEALQRFSDKNLFTKYIHGLLGVSETICNDKQKIKAVKQAWLYGLECNFLDNEMFKFGFEIIKMENVTAEEEVENILDLAYGHNPQNRYIWEQKLHIYLSDHKNVAAILQDANKVLKPHDTVYLWNYVLDLIESKEVIVSLYKKLMKFRTKIENVELLSLKPKLLKKMYEHTSLNAARQMYEEMIRLPPTQLELHKVMIDIEQSQGKPCAKSIRKCFECSVQHHGAESVTLWLDYMKFESEIGSIQNVSSVHRRAISMLKTELVDEFIKAQTLLKLK